MAVDVLVEQGYASTKAALVRQAITKFVEDQAVFAVLQSEQEAREGKILRGDLRRLLKKRS